MDHLPDLLAAMYQAPRCGTLRGAIRQWTDHERRRELRERQRGALSVSIVIGGVAEPELLTHVLVGDGCTRVTTNGSTTIRRPDVTLWHTAGSDAVRSPTADQPGFRYPDWLWAPRLLIATVDIGAIDPAVRAGRAVWQVMGRGADDSSGPFAFAFAGDRYDFEVDQATGVVLAMRVSLDTGETLDEIEWTEFEPDCALPDDAFELVLPAGERLRSMNEMRLEALAREGVDISGVDPDDEDAVAELLHQRRAWRSTLDPLAQIVPTGEPPADEDAARAAIEAAFGTLGERDGDRLVNVQAGDGLAPYLDRASERFPATLRADRVKFLSATAAAVVVVIEREDGSHVIAPQTMRAVVEDGRWKVERSSLTSLLGMAGVHCPPPER